jgi:hypothetical protein
LGVYPDIELRKARKRTREARQLLADGIDPSENRKAIKAAREERAANSFEVIAREWIGKHMPTSTKDHGGRILARFARICFRGLRVALFQKVQHRDYSLPCDASKNRGTLKTAHRALSNCGQVFRYAIATRRENAIRAAICLVPYPRSRANTWLRLSNPSALPSCCA